MLTLTDSKTYETKGSNSQGSSKNPYPEPNNILNLITLTI